MFPLNSVIPCFSPLISRTHRSAIYPSEMPDKVVLKAAALRGGSLSAVSSLIMESRGIEVTRHIHGHAKDVSTFADCISPCWRVTFKWPAGYQVASPQHGKYSFLFFFFSPFFSSPANRPSIRRAYKRHAIFMERQVLECLAKDVGLGAISSYARTRVNKVGMKTKMDTYLLYRKSPTYI